MNEDPVKIYPTRYLGGKARLLEWIWENTKHLPFHSIIDPFAGSGAVSYLYKQKGKMVHSNDFLRMNHGTLLGLIENHATCLADDDIERMLRKHPDPRDLIKTQYTNLFFPEVDTAFLDHFHANLQEINDPYKAALLSHSIQRAILARTSYGRFTSAKVACMEGKTIRDLFVETAQDINRYVTENGCANRAYCQDALKLIPSLSADAIYIDPPYGNRTYSRYEHFYGFCEAFAHYPAPEVLEGPLKRLSGLTSPFSDGRNHRQVFRQLLMSAQHIPIWIFSYNSNFGSRLDYVVDAILEFRSQVDIIERFDETAAKRDAHREYLLVAE